MGAEGADGRSRVNRAGLGRGRVEVSPHWRGRHSDPFHRYGLPRPCRFVARLGDGDGLEAFF